MQVSNVKHGISKKFYTCQGYPYDREMCTSHSV